MNGKINSLDLSRRQLMKYGAGFVGTGMFTAAVGSHLVQPELAVAQNKITPDEALALLTEGNKRFIEGKSQNINRDMKRVVALTEAQTPFAAILGCADSRVPLEIIFDRGFGDLFVVRNAGNTATPEEIGSLEFGTLVLGAKVLVVMGHAACGAVKATLEGSEVPGKIASVLKQIEPAVQAYQGQQEDKNALKKATEANVLYQIEKLKQSSVISELITSGKLKIVGAYYNIETAEVTTIL